MPYFSVNSCGGKEPRLDIVEQTPSGPRLLSYVKSVDTTTRIIEEVVFDGFMSNGRPRPRLLYGRPVTRTRFASFDVIWKDTGHLLYSVRM